MVWKWLGLDPWNEKKLSASSGPVIAASSPLMDKCSVIPHQQERKGDLGVNKRLRVG